MSGNPDALKTSTEVVSAQSARAAIPNVIQFIELLLQRAATDPALRGMLYDAARSVVVAVEAMQGDSPSAVTPSSHAEAPAVRPPVMVPYKTGVSVPASLVKPAPAGTVGMIPPSLRDPSGQTALTGWQAQAPGDEDLPTIEARCRLKAEASRWAGQRQRLLKDGADFHTEVEPRDRDVIGRAKALPECFLWMNHKDTPIPRDLSIFDDMAGAYETTASAITLLRSMLKVAREEREVFGEVLQLTAEAQSCVRGAVIQMDGKPDRDQMKIFYWLRAAGADYQILIRRFMRQDDIADFRSWPDVRRRLEELEGRLAHLKNRDKQQKLLVNKIRHLSKKVMDKPADSDWVDLLHAVDEFISCGVQPSNKELRDMLLPVVDHIPDLAEMPEYSKNVGLVLREIDNYRTTVGEEEAAPEEEDVSPEVKQAAKLLGGKALVLIGGDRRPAAEAALIKSFGLSDLFWIETREHQTHTVFEPYVSRDDVAAVILAIRWSSHGFGEVKDFCDRYDKPLVRLPAGYSPNQVAHHVVNQIGERLTSE